VIIPLASREGEMMERHRPNTQDITTITHTESFANELDDRSVYCKRFCDAIYQRKGQSVKQFWIAMGAVAVLIASSIGFTFHQGVILTQCQDKIAQHDQQIQGLQAALNDIADIKVILMENNKMLKLNMPPIRRGQ
jgi:hypothetical protein